jgi:thioredoxin-dependent peroxiredoxin
LVCAVLVSRPLPESESEVTPMMPKEGDSAPDFTVRTHENKRVSLSDLRGQKVLLWFYPEADTPGCTAEGRGFRDQQNYFVENNIAVLGVSFNTVEDNAAFARKNGFNFPLLCDTDRTLGMAYGACDEPKERYAKRISFLIDENGKIERVYDHVDPRDHPARVLVDVIGE